jgi:hypothetical protein
MLQTFKFDQINSAFDAMKDGSVIKVPSTIAGATRVRALTAYFAIFYFSLSSSGTIRTKHSGREQYNRMCGLRLLEYLLA